MNASIGSTNSTTAVWLVHVCVPASVLIVVGGLYWRDIGSGMMFAGLAIIAGLACVLFHTHRDFLLRATLLFFGLALLRSSAVVVPDTVTVREFIFVWSAMLASMLTAIHLSLEPLRLGIAAFGRHRPLTDSQRSQYSYLVWEPFAVWSLVFGGMLVYLVTIGRMTVRLPNYVHPVAAIATAIVLPVVIWSLEVLSLKIGDVRGYQVSRLRLGTFSLGRGTFFIGTAALAAYTVWHEYQTSQLYLLAALCLGTGVAAFLNAGIVGHLAEKASIENMPIRTSRSAMQVLVLSGLTLAVTWFHIVLLLIALNPSS